MAISEEMPTHIAELARDVQLGRLVQSFMALRNLQFSSQDVYVFERGGVFVEGRQDPTVIAWEQVTQFFQAVTREKHLVDKVSYRYRFVLQDGTEHKIRAATTLGMKSGLEQFGPLIDDLIARAIVPRLLRTILDGGVVSFNNLWLDANGIAGHVQVKGVRGTVVRQIPWAEVAGCKYGQIYEGGYNIRTTHPAVVIQATTDSLGITVKAVNTCNQSALFTIVKRFVNREVMPAHPARRAREPLAKAQGWKFAARDTKESYRKLGALFGYPVADAVYGRLAGYVDGHLFGLFDVLTGNGLDRTMWWVVLPGKVPVVAVTARSGEAAPDRARGTGDPEFDDAYESASREPGAVGQLLTPAVRQRILRTRPARLMTAGTMLIHVTPYPDAEAIPSALRDLASIAALIPVPSPEG